MIGGGALMLVGIPNFRVRTKVGSGKFIPPKSSETYKNTLGILITYN